MVTATTGTIWCKGRSNKDYFVSCYISDVAAAAITFNQNGAAISSSPSQLQFPEDVVLKDISVLSGPTVATGFTVASGNITIPSTNILLGNVYSTLQTRRVPQIGFRANAIITATQF